MTIVLRSLTRERRRPSRVRIIIREFVKNAISEEALLEVDVSGELSPEHMAEVTRIAAEVFQKK